MSSEFPAPYEQLGGEPAVRRLVARFYQEMDHNPAARGIRAMHADLPGAEQKLFEFLSGWLGGPPLFVEKYGHPRLRARHLPFAIGESERDQWLMCMQTALAEEVPDEALRRQLFSSFARLADHMRNRD